MSELMAKITQIKEHLKMGDYPNERTITTRVVMPILYCLEWNVDDPLVVQEEYRAIPDQASKKVDLALFKTPNDNKPEVYIEVKDHGKIQNPEKEAEAEKQLWDYDRHNRVNLAILTDGQTWHFYYPFATGSYSDRKAYSLDFLSRTVEDVSHYLTMLLSFGQIKNGEALKSLKQLHKERAEVEKTRAEFPEVWGHLLEEPNEFFLEGISSAFEQHRGFPPNEQILKTILKEIAKKQFFVPPDVGPAEGSNNEDEEEIETTSGERRGRSKIAVRINWQVIGKTLPAESIDEGSGAATLAKLIERLAKVCGQNTLERLSTLSVSRGALVTRKPNPKYQYKRVMGHFVLTHSATNEKIDIMRKVCSHLSFPRDFLEVKKIIN